MKKMKKDAPTIMKPATSLPIKYRPTSFNDIVGNVGVISVLTGYFNNGKYPPATLLAGDTGTGKTTIARIMGRIINCQNLKNSIPCGVCESCKLPLHSHPDIIEINATVARTLDNVKDVITRAYYAPTFNLKCIIIDEVQGYPEISVAALLKPLEEPPKKTMWILCTTHPHKIPKPTQGRCCTLYTGYPNREELRTHLIKIMKSEYSKDIRIKIKPYLNLIIEHTNNQPESAIQTLEYLSMACSDGKIKDIDTIIKKYVGDIASIESNVLNFITALFKNKIRIPLKIVVSLESNIVEEFINVLYKYALYASLYYTHKTANEKLDVNIYGINTFNLIKILDQVKVDYIVPLKLCDAVVKMLSTIRTGVISPQQSLISLIYNFVS